MRARRIIPTGTVAGRLREARLALGWGIGAAAHQIGCNPSYLSKLESGTARNPSVDFLRRVAMVLQVDLPWLEIGIGQPHSSLSQSEAIQRDAELLAILPALLDQMTLAQLLAAANQIGGSKNLNDVRKGLWLAMIAPWISAQSKNASAPGELELAQQHIIQNKWRLMADSEQKHWSQLLNRVARATSQRGSRAQLARMLKVTPQALNEWLQNRSAPPAEQTLRLLRWVEEIEAKQKNAPEARKRDRRKRPKKAPK